MSELDLSVVITTFNRSRLVGRAIQSVLDQNWPTLELMVVDDASSDDTLEVIRNSFPCVRYLRRESNRGVGAARNLALRRASRPWVLFLDDDDTLYPNALTCLAMQIATFPDAERYPVLQFACSNGHINSQFMVVTMADYITGRIVGDFVPLIRREYFQAEGLAYPEFRVPGERLLWWKVADKHGIPTWADKIVDVHNDAALRVTTARYQLLHAREFAEVQEYALNEFGDVLASKFPAYYRKGCLGAATYRLLANQRAIARFHLQLAVRKGMAGSVLALWALSYLPLAFVRRCFETYRKRAERVNASM